MTEAFIQYRPVISNDVVVWAWTIQFYRMKDKNTTEIFHKVDSDNYYYNRDRAVISARALAKNYIEAIEQKGEEVHTLDQQGSV